MIIGCFVIGGALGGIAGVGEIGGIHHRLLPEFSAGFGFTGIAIALLGRSGVQYVVLGSLLFGILFVTGSALETVLAVPFAIVNVMEALVILFLVTAEFFRRYHVDIQVHPSTASSMEGE
jgi:simple sugar transport system permease protein